jgi:hypothetical protein
MPPLKNEVHEKFAWLIAEGGLSQAQAYLKIVPTSVKSAHVTGHNIYHRPEVKARVAEIAQEVATRSVMTISRKREILRQMVEGNLPTKVTRSPGGRYMATFDRLSALMVDARMAGEFAPEKHEVVNASDLKLEFSTKGRNTAIVEVQAEVTPVEQKPVESLPTPDQKTAPPPDFTQYEQVEIDPDGPQLRDF